MTPSKTSKKNKPQNLTGGIVLLVIIGVLFLFQQLNKPSKPATGSGPVTTNGTILTRDSNDSGPWYEGGILHKSTARSWSNAGRGNRLATSADFAAAALQDKFNGMDELKSYATEMMFCINESIRVNNDLNKRVSTIAAACAVLLGW